MDKGPRRIRDVKLREAFARVRPPEEERDTSNEDYQEAAAVLQILGYELRRDEHGEEAYYYPDAPVGQDRERLERFKERLGPAQSAEAKAVQPAEAKAA